MPAATRLRLRPSTWTVTWSHWKPMNLKSRHGTLGLVGTILLATFAHNAVAAGNAPANAFNGAATHLSDASLPAQAMRGTGLSGQFNPQALDASSVALTLGDGRTIAARVQRVAIDSRKDSKSWVGTFPDQPGSVLVMTTYRGVTTGFASYGSETWEIVPAKAGGHVLYRVDESKFQQRDKALEPPATSGDVVSSTSTTSGSTTSASGGYVHDVLVVYTPAARARWGQATLEGMIQNAVQAANQAYQNSHIAITLNLVGMQQIQYVESGDLSTSVYALQGTTDGKMDGVHALRDKLGADVVSLISEDTSACGIAFTMRSESASFASSAFNVVQSSCLSQHSLAHEIGHNQGNQHDRASSTNVGVLPYSYGYRVCNKTDGTGWRDVMSPLAARIARPADYPACTTTVARPASHLRVRPGELRGHPRSMNATADTVSAFRAPTTSTTTTSPTAPSRHPHWRPRRLRRPA
jgi:uncharacterized protein YunC (DUF1805 family)